MSNRLPDKRAVSPVVGAVLLVAIVAILAGGSAYAILDLSEEREPQPDVALEITADEDGLTHYFRHEHGSALDGDKVTLRGAADPDALSGSELSASEEVTFLPVDEEIKVVYTGEHGTTYMLERFEPELTFPEPDEGCDWVDAESNGGTENVKIDGLVVDCDVTTDEVIEVQNGGVVIGDTESDTKEVDADDAVFYGPVEVETNVNLQDGEIRGSVVARTENVKIDNGTVGGSIQAAKVVEVVDGSSAGGDLVSDGKTVKVLDSAVSGSIVTDGDVKLEDATVEGDVYVESADFDCTSSTINGEDCSTYSPKDPDDA